MADLSKPWPLGLDRPGWWRPIVAAAALLALLLPLDHGLSLWAQGWPAPLRGFLSRMTPYGESNWILVPTGALYVVTALLALTVRWKLMRTLLWEFAALYAFIFFGVGLPSLVSTIVKRGGRPRPMHYGTDGLFGLHPNWADWTYQSFPSGHATTAFALAACIGFLSRRWFYPALIFASLIALSRVSEGVHYPTDIAAGAMLGLIGAYGVRWWFARRGWVFATAPDGHIAARPMAALLRYISIKRRDIAPGPPTGRP